MRASSWARARRCFYSPEASARMTAPARNHAAGLRPAKPQSAHLCGPVAGNNGRKRAALQPQLPPARGAPRQHPHNRPLQDLRRPHFVRRRKPALSLPAAPPGANFCGERRIQLWDYTQPRLRQFKGLSWRRFPLYIKELAMRYNMRAKTSPPPCWRPCAPLCQRLRNAACDSSPYFADKLVLVEVLWSHPPSPY